MHLFPSRRCWILLQHMEYYDISYTQFDSGLLLLNVGHITIIDSSHHIMVTQPSYRHDTAIIQCYFQCIICKAHHLSPPPIPSQVLPCKRRILQAPAQPAGIRTRYTMLITGKASTCWVVQVLYLIDEPFVSTIRHSSMIFITFNHRWLMKPFLSIYVSLEVYPWITLEGESFTGYLQPAEELTAHAWPLVDPWGHLNGSMFCPYDVS